MYKVESTASLVRLHRRVRLRERGAPMVPRAVVLLGLTSLFTDVSSEMVVTVLPLYLVAVHGFSPLAFGVVDGIQQGAAALVRIAGGYVADRTRRHKGVAVAGYGLSAICRLALTLVGTTVAAIGAVVLADRIGKGIRTAPRDAMISLSARPETLGIAFGVHRALDTTGAMLGPLLAFAILAVAPLAFQSVFVVSFCFALVGLAILVLLVPGPAAPVAPDAERPSPRAVGRLLAVRRFRVLMVVAAMLGVATASDAFLYLALQRDLGFDMTVFPLLFVGTSLVFMVLAVPVGRLADRAGRARVFVGGHVLLLAAYAVVLASGPALVSLLAVMALLGTFYAATDGVLAALGASMLPESLRGSGLALVATASSLARLSASIALGALWTVAGAETAFLGFTGALAAAIVLAAVALPRAAAVAR